MPPQKFPAVLVAALSLIMVLSSSVCAAEYKALYKFTGAENGQYSYAGVIFDAAGNLYGTTTYGGTNHQGTVFRLTSNPNGTWTDTTLYSFKGDDDGSIPEASLVFDAAGNLYGTTQSGGIRGTVFELIPQPDGSWKEKVLHRFSGQDGSVPFSSLTFDSAGNLYGTTSLGGLFDLGTVFKMTPNPDGTWTESVLHSFSGSDGEYPYAGLIFDASGNLYGTAQAAGPHSFGTAFRLIPNPDGSWTEQVIFSFGKKAAGPIAGLIFDGAGNLYGTTIYANGSPTGTVFRLSPNPDGTWSKQTLHTFIGSDGAYPYAGLAFDAVGNLYGTTTYGGRYDSGTVFRMAAHPDGHWKFTRLHSFKLNHPRGGLIADAVGNFYGVTPYGGPGESGVVFEMTP